MTPTTPGPRTSPLDPMVLVTLLLLSLVSLTPAASAGRDLDHVLHVLDHWEAPR